MGRGRARAKQTKVARNLKYRSVEMDIASLERELRGEPAPAPDDDPDSYADLAAKYNKEFGEDDDHS